MLGAFDLRKPRLSEAGRCRVEFGQPLKMTSEKTRGYLQIGFRSSATLARALIPGWPAKLARRYSGPLQEMDDATPRFIAILALRAC